MSGRERPWYVSVGLALLAVAFVVALFMRGVRTSPLQGEPAPTFSLPVAFDGAGQGSTDRIRLADLAGHVVLLDFWASWCGPCKASVPELNRLARAYQERGVRVLGINSEAMGPGRLSFTALSWAFAYPVLADSALEAARAYRIDAYPTLFVIDRGGVVRFVHFGMPGAAALKREIDSLLEELHRDFLTR